MSEVAQAGLGKEEYAYSTFSSLASFGVIMRVASCSPLRIVIFVSLPMTSSVSSDGRL